MSAVVVSASRLRIVDGVRPMPHVFMVRVIFHTLFVLGAIAGRQAQHGRGHRAPDGDQQREQQQKPDASGSHEFQGITDAFRNRLTR